MFETRTGRPLADPMLPRPFRVVSSIAETSDVWTITFEPADDEEAIRFEPAQIGMVGLPGIGEVPISFSSDADGDVLAMTIRAAGAVTKALVGVAPGDLVMMRGPFGVPWPIHRAHGKHLLVAAGGLGLAPLRALIVAASRIPDRFESISLVYGARDPEEFLFRPDLEAWKAGGVDVRLTVDRPTSSWEGGIGVVTTLFGDVLRHPAETVTMMCGPDVMLGAAAIALNRAGVPANQVWVTMERNMKCAIGLCGHCQFGRLFLCKDGPVLRYDRIAHLFAVPEV
ncbi:MAG: FAD/NAD(P)-binding protein [Acidimicrobiia bacterium]